jgi:hypothetical protein
VIQVSWLSLIDACSVNFDVFNILAWPNQVSKSKKAINPNVENPFERAAGSDAKLAAALNGNDAHNHMSLAKK